MIYDNRSDGISNASNDIGTGINSETPIEQLNSLLRGEISAVETYRMAIDKLAGGKADSEANVAMLRNIQEEHGRSAQTLRTRIRESGGEAADSSGAWGAWANAVQGLMDLFGSVAAIKSLKEGEEHGLKDYQDGLRKLDPASAQLIQNQMIPAQERHVWLLTQLISQETHA